MKFIDLLQYIEDHLDEKLTAELIAEYAHYSPYHFQRMFAGAVGVSLGTYIRRRKLTKAAIRLRETTDRIIEVAFESGFESQEAFTRSFKNVFGTTPNDYRKNQNLSRFSLLEKIDTDFLAHIKSDGVNLEPEYIHKDGFVAIGIKETFNHDNAKIGQLWDQLVSRMHEIPNIKNKEAFGICKEIWIDGKIQDEFSYMAAVPVESNAIAPEGMEKIEIPSAKFAVFTHKGPLKTFGKTNQYIWSIWLPQSGKELGPTYDIEMYPSDFNPDAKETTIEVWLPIK